MGEATGFADRLGVSGRVGRREKSRVLPSFLSKTGRQWFYLPRWGLAGVGNGFGHLCLEVRGGSWLGLHVRDLGADGIYILSHEVG